MIRLEYYPAMEGNAGLNRKKEDPNELARQEEDPGEEGKLHPVYSSGSSRSSAAVSPQTSSRSKKKGEKDRKLKRKNMPRRPLTAYNLFFQSERKRLVASIHGDATDLLVAHKERRHRKVNGIGFANMAKIIAKNWKALTPSQRAVYDQQARADRARYEREMRQLDRQGVEMDGGEGPSLPRTAASSVARLPQRRQPTPPPQTTVAPPQLPFPEPHDPNLLGRLSSEPAPSDISRDIFNEDLNQQRHPDPVISDVPPASAQTTDVSVPPVARVPSPVEIHSSTSDQLGYLDPLLASSAFPSVGAPVAGTSEGASIQWHNASETDAAFDEEIMQIAPISGFSAPGASDLFEDDDSFSSP